ncbi:MAG: universal stress protein [Deltaproteobacteria bacterium]|nr:universal stress protein [Deltaproteobacteria bacterium]
MLPIKNILCPTDLSDPSFEALEAACELALHFSSMLIVIHVVPPIPPVTADPMSPGTFNVPPYQQQMELSESAKKVIEERIQQRVPEKVPVHIMVVMGDPADQIVTTAEDEKADLIVIATRGQTGLKRLVFGSVAEKVVRLAAQPVLTIRGPRTDDRE